MTTAISIEGITDAVEKLQSAMVEIQQQATGEKQVQAAAATDQLEGIKAQLAAVVEQQFIKALMQMGQRIYSNAVSKGWWGEDGKTRNYGETVALIHAEASELLEAMRELDPPMSTKIPGFTLEEEETADIIIRTLDLAIGRGQRIAEAMLAKHKYNLTRPHKHGKRF